MSVAAEPTTGGEAIQGAWGRGGQEKQGAGARFSPYNCLMKNLFILIVFFACTQVGHAAFPPKSVCGLTAALAGAQKTATIDWQLYEKTRQYLNKLPLEKGLNGKGWLDSKKLLADMQKMEALWQPEAMMALADSLNPVRATKFVTQLREMEKRGDRMLLRPYTINHLPEIQSLFSGWGWHLRQPKARRPRIRWRVPMFKWNRTLYLFYPNAPPQTEDDIFQYVTRIRLAVTTFDLHQKANRIKSFLRLPFGSWKYSYPAKVNEALRAATESIVTTTFGLDAAFKSYQQEHPKESWFRLPRTAKYLLDFLQVLVLPKYNPVASFTVNEGHYQAFLRDVLAKQEKLTVALQRVVEKNEFDLGDSKKVQELQKDIAKRYSYRGRINWFKTHWRMFVFGSLSVGLATGGYMAYQLLSDGQLKEKYNMVLNETRAAYGRLSQENYVQDAADEYVANAQGSPLVLNHYNPRIEALRRELEAKGGKDEKIENEIIFLTEMRDSLKN